MVKDAATVIVLRDQPAPAEVELFCVRRHAQSAFMGGVVVFPGGKLDTQDGRPELTELSTGVHPRALRFAHDAAHALALAICATRETLEEAAIVACSPPVDAETAMSWQAVMSADPRALPALIGEAGRRIITGDLLPFARWITPEVEQRRYDARFFMLRAPEGQRGRHDARETTSGMWSTPARLLGAFDKGDVMLAPPTVRALELLSTVQSVEQALALALQQSLEPICPELVQADPPFLALPGDPEHSTRERRVAGSTRFVLRGGRFVSDDPLGTL